VARNPLTCGHGGFQTRMGLDLVKSGPGRIRYIEWFECSGKCSRRDSSEGWSTTDPAVMKVLDPFTVLEPIRQVRIPPNPSGAHATLGGLGSAIGPHLPPINGLGHDVLLSFCGLRRGAWAERYEPETASRESTQGPVISSPDAGCAADPTRTPRSGAPRFGRDRTSRRAPSATAPVLLRPR